MTAPRHTVLCLNGPCPDDCDAWRVERGLPRDPDLSEFVGGQMVLDVTVKEDAR